MKQGCHVLTLLTYGLSGLLSETIEIHTEAASSLLHRKVCGSRDRRREAVREDRGWLSWRQREKEVDEQTQLEEAQLRSLSSQSYPTLGPPIPVPRELELSCVSATRRVMQALGELLAAGCEGGPGCQPALPKHQTCQDRWPCPLRGQGATGEAGVGTPLLSLHVAFSDTTPETQLVPQSHQPVHSSYLCRSTSRPAHPPLADLSFFGKKADQPGPPLSDRLVHSRLSRLEPLSLARVLISVLQHFQVPPGSPQAHLDTLKGRELPIKLRCRNWPRKRNIPS